MTAPGAAGAPIRGAVIGLGAMGRHHARIMASIPNVSLVACCDSDLARAKEHATPLGAAAIASSADLPDDLDFAVIATPTVTHRAIAEPLLRRGVSCLVEKPIAPSLGEADAMIGAALEGGSVLHIGHGERFNPALLAVRSDITEPLFVESHRLGGFPERSLDVDVVLDLMIHDIDLLLWLSGGDVEDVSAIGVNVLTPHVDIATARLVLSTGCAANLTASRVSAEPTRKLRIFQPASYVSVDLRERVAEVVALDHSGGARPQIIRAKKVPASDAAEPLRLEQEEFLKARAGKPSLGTTGVEGRRALDVALRVVAALDAHAARVALARAKR